MARRVGLPFWMAGLWECGTFAAALAETPDQLADAQHAVRVTLGQSALPLYGPWKFTVGDSPIDPSTGLLLWAEPDFDDSRWETVDVTPKNDAIEVANAAQSFGQDDDISVISVTRTPVAELATA